MKMIKKYFLNADAWQLSLLMVTPYLVYKFTQFGHNPVEWGFLVFYFLMVSIGWVHSVGSSANRELPEENQMPLLYFQLASLLPFFYLPVFVLWFLVPLSQGEIQQPPQWLIFVHFAALIAIVYCLWFTAKQFTTLREKQEASVVEYYPPFMGFWFGFIGAWFLQPQIKALFANTKQ